MTLADLRSLVASDVFLACLLPLLILLLTLRHLSSISISSFSLRDLRLLLAHSSSSRVRFPSLSPHKHAHFSLECAYLSYTSYTRLSTAEQSTMRASYARLGRTGKRIGYSIGYTAKLDRLREATIRNSVVADGVAACAGDAFPGRVGDVESGIGWRAVGNGDLGRVREAMKHFVRDWSEEGSAERGRIFEPILEFLRTATKEEEREEMHVLVPGCGLGRLAWEISELGYNTTANELSFFMTLALHFILSPKYTPTINEHIIRPYAHWFSHQRTNESLFRTVSFPDALPRLSERFHLLEEDFLKLPIPSAKAKAKAKEEAVSYDFIVTLFFIDTSLDIFATLSHIFALLKPGGTWVNLGPLLWTGGGQASAELSLEEVLAAAREVGFVVHGDDGLEGKGNKNGEEEKKEKEMGDPARRRTVECEYTSDKEAMMRWIYKAEYWVARKPL